MFTRLAKPSLLAFTLLFFLNHATIAQQLARSNGSAKPVSQWQNDAGGRFVPQWCTPMYLTNPGHPDDRVKAEAFEGATLDENIVNLSYRQFLIPIDNDEALTIRSVNPENITEITSEDFRETAQTAAAHFKGEWYPENWVIPGEIVKRKGRSYQFVRIYPVQVNRNGLTIRKAGAINYAIGRVARKQGGNTAGSLARTYTQNSVLATGTWYKIGITQEGMVQLDRQFFQNLGVDPNSIDPRTIRIHGNGGYMLPQVAGAWDLDDLVENAIQVLGEGDGQFDNGDKVLFYGQSPHEVYYSTLLHRYVHRNNVYSDTTFYFLTWGNGLGKRIATTPSLSNSTYQPTETVVFKYYEKDLSNPIKSGRSWLGESFDFTTRRAFPFKTPNIIPGSQILFTARLAQRCNNPGTFLFYENNAQVASMIVPATNSAVYNTPYYYPKDQTFTLSGNYGQDGEFSLELEYQKPLSNALGFLDYLELEYKSQLNINSATFWKFMERENTGPGTILGYTLSGGNAAYQIWNITDITEIERQDYSLNGSQIQFNAAAETPQTFVAFRESGAIRPVSAKRINTQNIHGLPAAEYLIITHPNFKNAAESLADFHRQEFGRTVHVIQIHEVFNEFSSGGMDPTALRDCIKMFYDRHLSSGQAPRYVLLFGEGSYDYKNRIAVDETNFIPTYQSRSSYYASSSYTSDDYYGLVEDGDGFWGEKAGLVGAIKDVLYYADGDTAVNTHDLQIAIGRLPVATAEEADDVVHKIIEYRTGADRFGRWRNEAIMIADHLDTDGNGHALASNYLGEMVRTENPVINVEKVFMDNYEMVVTASGTRFPAGREDVKKYLDHGSLLVNYTGHGGEIAWSNSTILDITAIQNLENGNKLPAYVTATCEFGRWDDPHQRCGAEELLLRPEGGAIAMFTTVRVVYSNSNDVINRNFYRHVFKRNVTENRMPTLGEVYMATKNDSWMNSINNRNFTLLGDPGLPLAYPEWKAVVETINGQSALDTLVDSLPALSLVTLNGSIQDDNGAVQTGFSGNIQVTVFDKPLKFITRRAPFPFYWQKTRLFNGQASVVNGRFSVQFVVPIDVSYENGLGKISLYADNGMHDAAGNNQEIFIGGSGSNTLSDNQSPELELFMNDLSFVDGGMVDPDPMLIAQVFDENGINTAGTGIGHELTGVLDFKDADILILNDYYTAEKNSYQRGEIRFPFKDLAPGEHTLEVKVWDVANNSQKGKIDFLVADNAEMALGHVLNYPNPFSTHTQFMVEHNLNGRFLTVRVKIFTVGGHLVKHLEDSFLAEGNLYKDMEWDGLDEFGDVLGRGVYVYQVTVMDNESREQVNRFEKLVLLR